MELAVYLMILYLVSWYLVSSDDDTSDTVCATTLSSFKHGLDHDISEALYQGWHFGCFLVFLGPRRLYSLSGKYSPSIPFPIEPDVPGTQSTRLRPQFHTESLIGKPMAQQPRCIAQYKYNKPMIFNVTYSPSIIYSPGPETKFGIPTLLCTHLLIDTYSCTASRDVHTHLTDLRTHIYILCTHVGSITLC